MENGRECGGHGGPGRREAHLTKSSKYRVSSCHQPRRIEQLSDRIYI